jgi:uncharacterized protein YrrD
MLPPVSYGVPIAAAALEGGGDVISSDGERVGKVEHVLVDEATDIFDGIVIDAQTGLGGVHFVDAEQVDEIYERAVVLRVPAAEVERLPKPAPNPAAMEAHADESPEGPLQRKLHRAWDMLSGNY